MKPLNRQARNSAIGKFIFFLFVFLILAGMAVFLNLEVPASYSPKRVVLKKEPEWMPAFKEKLDEIIANQKKVNLLFVVDATPGMAPYVSATSEAILNSPAWWQDTTLEVRYSASYYRDALEGNFVWDYSGRRYEYDAVGTWLSRVIAQVRDDRDKPEAVYYGLRESLKTDFLEKGQTNVVILIGDAGNHAQDERTDVPPDEIVQLLVDKSAHFFAIQVNHPTDDPTYDQFIPQLQDEILTPVITQRQNQLKEYPQLAENLPAINWETESDESGEHLIIHQGNSGINDLLALPPNEKLPPEQLQVQLEKIIKEVDQEVLQNIAVLEELKTSDSLDISKELAISAIYALNNGGVEKSQINHFLNKPSNK